MGKVDKYFSFYSAVQNVRCFFFRCCNNSSNIDYIIVKFRKKVHPTQRMKKT